MQIDESTIFNRDFVRIKIACRNVELVPPSAECNLGMYIYDFLFEREVSQDDDMLNHEVANAVENPEVQASPKRPRTETIFGASGSKTDKGKDHVQDSFQGKQHCRTGSVVDVAVKLPGSAPGKLLSSKFKVQTSKPVEGEIGENLGVEEAIPAATYIPRDDDLIDDSDSSTDFEKKSEYCSGNRK